MAVVDGRTAFELCLIQQRKDSGRITGLAVDNDGLRFYVGLHTGFIEEYKVVYGRNGCVARVCARRQASKKAVKDVCLLGGAGILAVLIEDGQLLLCDLEQLDPVPLPSSQNVAMVTCDPRYLSPCRFAVGFKSALRRSRVEIYEVAREWDALPKPIAQHSIQEDIKGLAWLGDDVIVASKSAYYAIHNGERKMVVEPTIPSTFVTLPIPGLIALMWHETLAVICGSDGVAARPPLTFSESPLLLTQGGMCIVAGLPFLRPHLFSPSICSSVSATEGITIYDQKTSKLVQRIPFNLKNLAPGDEEDIVLHQADTPSGSTILLSTARSVYMLRPVAHEAQTVQLMKTGNVEAAIELAENCLTDSWAEDVFAQAGLLLLQERKWKYALECFERCTPSVFQPSQLFQLFPNYTRKWADRVCIKSYWGLHSELKSLGARYTTEVDTDLPEPEFGANGQGIHDDSIARHYIAEYFLKIRDRPNTHCIEGIDTLIIHLFSSIADLTRLEEFVQSSHEVELDDVRSHLTKHQQFISLALLCWKKGQVDEALEILKDLSFSKKKEAKTKSGSVYQANGKQERVAFYYASRIMADPELEPRSIEAHLKWLAELSPSKFLYICQHRLLPSSIVLDVIGSDREDLRFRYLHHLVHTSQHPTQETRHHTQLAQALCGLLEGYQNESVNEEKLPFMLASDDNYYQYPESRLSQSQRNILYFDSTLGPRMRVSLEDPPEGFFEDDQLAPFTPQELRDILQRHLLLSKGYDALGVRQSIEESELFEEQVIVSCRLQDHLRALRVVAIRLRDVTSAIRYCKRYAGSGGFIALLDMLLKPGGGSEPFFSDAVRVLDAESGSLDPMRVLNALSESMPLEMAYPTLARMLRERTHRCRQTRITANLQRVQNMFLKAEKYPSLLFTLNEPISSSRPRFELESSILGRVFVDSDSECALCRKPLGGRIFYRYQSGATVCGMCQRERQTTSLLSVPLTDK